MIKVNISKDFAELLKLDVDKTYNKIDVFKTLTKYLDENNLRPDIKKPYINTNDSLCKLLDIQPNYKLDFFNIIDLLKPHIFEIIL